MTCAIEEFAAFLAQFLGGPAEDAQRRWWVSLRESHLRFKIGQKERAAWMKNMMATLDETQIQEPVRSALRDFFERSSAYVVNSGPAATVAEAGDTLGETPLRRSVNCDKPEVASLLLSTPLLPARSSAMKRLLRSSPKIEYN